MIKGILKHINTHTKTEEIELPDTADTGDIICLISEAIRKSNYKHCINREIFEIALEDGRVYHCYEQVPNKYRLYVYYIDEEGEEYYCIADFRF